MLFLATVVRWQCDSWKRVRNATTGTQYLLNTNRLDSIIPRANGAISTLYYFDNPLDYRDRGNYMILPLTVAELITQMDTALGHASITLDMYTNNDPTQVTVATTIAVGNFAYAVADVNDSTRSWVTYAEAGWDIKTVLVNHTLAAMLALVV
jgi:hypothetical protein